MLEFLKYDSLDSFVKDVLPPNILSSRNLKVEPSNGLTESELLAHLKKIAKKNKTSRSYIGCGYTGTITPAVIQRNILECPEWYTSYTPYQPEISQGRLESLINFQTLVTDLTGLDIANASVLDEATAACEAMTMSLASMPSKRQKREGRTFFVDKRVHPQTIACLASRAEGFGIHVKVGDALDVAAVKAIGDDLIGGLVQYPATDGSIHDYGKFSEVVHELGAPVSMATDLLALTMLKPPSEVGADIAFGNAQRFGVPMGYGGPHAAFFATKDSMKRKMPGRIIGVSKDRLGDSAYRLALQTREQHIRREKATSNICTAQALLANMSAMYAVYHGPAGLKAIAQRVHSLTAILAEGIQRLGFEVNPGVQAEGGFFDTVTLRVADAKDAVAKIADWYGINLRPVDDQTISITLDETVTQQDMEDILAALSAFAERIPGRLKWAEFVNEIADDLSITATAAPALPEAFQRTTSYLEHPVFNTYHSETEMLRYIHHLQTKDLSLANSMIPLGSCTMKLNATTEMLPITWPEFNSLHPYVPREQAGGYTQLIGELEKDLADITGFDAVSVQPNSGAQGEFTGLRVIREYLKSIGQEKRDICIIPQSAHGTNPASASMAGMRVVSIKCSAKTGELDIADLRAKAEKYKDQLAAIMITYPSTFGVFEPGVKEACEIVHSHGGQVYMDGANMNAQIGLCSPGEIGADVCHLNLHKTFCIPHGGGGPGVGPIGVKSHLAPFLPGHPIVATGGDKAIAPVAAAPWGSASILPISWSYIKMMGARGLTHATKITLLNANYMAARLSEHYPILYTNDKGRCAHEFILDTRGFKETAGIEVIDIAKRLQDYGFHSPTMSWPVPNTLMIEPTESENLQELDRFCDALINIRAEIKEIEDGKVSKEKNVLKMAPHTIKDLVAGKWDREYTQAQAAYPLPYLYNRKFWPSVTRVDDAYGDLNLFCACVPVDAIE
ncbi:glycine dehydrogenase [Ascodesmis nigricans]|uniref:Glycine cleavage system P protein n=1 Tax=Ascodesmis nigricans TaxID=341454 RepID=A0A4S2MZL2_9PEZI|nr:glycine dehydrogenase [Ascodesmis nigricans]